MVTKEMSEFEALCTYITNLAPCMDDFLYALDLSNSEYFISESAVERFAMDTNHFFDAVEAHRKFVHPDDLAILMEDLNKIKRGEKINITLPTAGWEKTGKPSGLIAVAELSRERTKIAI